MYSFFKNSSFNSKTSSGVKVYLLFFFSILAISVPLVYVLNFDQAYYSLIVITTLGAYLILHKQSINKYVIYLSIFSLVCGFLVFIRYYSSGLSGGYRIVLYGQFLILTILFCQLLSRHDIERFVNIATYFMLILLIGAWIAFFYVIVGGQAIFSIQKQEGVKFYWYLSTFTKYPAGSFLRAAGIYDEPGAFSFFICFVALLRHQLGKNKKITWLLLGSGFVTFSLAHTIYVFFHLLAEKGSTSLKVLLFLVLTAVLIGVLFPNNVIYQAVNKKIVNRLETNNSNDEVISGDNRSVLLLNAYLHMNQETFLWGVDWLCAVNKPRCDKKYGPMGENPLWPLVSRGIFVAWPYYFTVLLYFFLGFKKRSNFVFIGFGLLFLQRPYVGILGYSFTAILPLYYHYCSDYFENNDNKYFASLYSKSFNQRS